MFTLLISNHTVFLVQFRVNFLLCQFFKKLNYTCSLIVQFQLFEKLTRANKFQIEFETLYYNTLHVINYKLLYEMLFMVTMMMIMVTILKKK